jgi:hypothetical protein
MQAITGLRGLGANAPRVLRRTAEPIPNQLSFSAAPTLHPGGAPHRTSSGLRAASQAAGITANRRIQTRGRVPRAAAADTRSRTPSDGAPRHRVHHRHRTSVVAGRFRGLKQRNLPCHRAERTTAAVLGRYAAAYEFACWASVLRRRRNRVTPSLSEGGNARAFDGQRLTSRPSWTGEKMMTMREASTAGHLGCSPDESRSRRISGSFRVLSKNVFSGP